MNKGVDIPSLDAKDIFVANNSSLSSKTGYSLKNKKGAYILKKFKNTFDYSLDLIVLRDIYFREYRNRKFSFKSFGHEYSTQIINVTFKYANRVYNQTNGNIYVKFGYDLKNLAFQDGVSIADGELAAIKLNEPILSPISSELLGRYFSVGTVEIKTKEKDENGHYKKETKQCYIKSSSITVLNSRKDLRKEVYKNGFVCDGIRYVRAKRSSGSARVGKCLFINERLYPRFHKWESWGLDIQEGQEIDLAAFESYISLTTSSIIDTLEIKPENILVIDDYESEFDDEAIATSYESGSLLTKSKTVELRNSIWDGQSLIDRSILGKYADKGMLLLRNGFFKSCCFNSNIQDWFSDNQITSLDQLNGFTLADNISDIKLITTPSSIKYLKFGSLEQWLHVIDSKFGVVKYDKPTHYLDGKMVQSHYQLINTLQLSKKEVGMLLQPSLEYIKLLRTDPAAVRYHIKYPEEKTFDNAPMKSKNDIVFQMLGVNDWFTHTKIYQEFLDTLIKAYIKKLKQGHILIEGNYSTLLGNPIEMLQQSIGQFHGASQMGIGNIYSTRFKFHQTLLGCRSPHVCAGNLWLAKNTPNSQIDKYINTTDQILCLNSINENVLQRLSGCDFDSDTVLLTDNAILIDAAQRNYKFFKVPTSLVEAKRTRRYYTPEHQADLDIKTSVNKIGEIVNLSQVLNSLYWDRIAHGQTHEENKELYYDICQLDVMSGIEIDKAKKEFDVNNAAELTRLRKKYEPYLTDVDTGKSILPHFFSHISKMKGYYNPDKKNYSKHKTSMDYIQTVVNSFHFQSCEQKYYEPFVYMLNKEKYAANRVNKEQVEEFLSTLNNFDSIRKQIWTSDASYEDNLLQYRMEKSKCCAVLDDKKIGYSTMYDLLSLLDNNSYRHLRNIMFYIFFSMSNNNFFDAILESQDTIGTLVMDDDAGTLQIYNHRFKRVLQKNCNLFDYMDLNVRKSLPNKDPKNVQLMVREKNILRRRDLHERKTEQL
jgi:hypothetical protein|nr:MAG TPA: RNA-dependent RNA polymerase [Caudoviricetes sp.]